MFSPKTVRVPASSANLGPGFDTLGIALSLYLECHFYPADQLEIRVFGRDAEAIPVDESNLIWTTALDAAKALGREMPGVGIVVNNEIPVGKGLGSSAAALTAGVVLADIALELGWDEHAILDVAARMEGHPDNVSASVLGSFTTAAIGPDGVTRAIRLEIPDAFSVAVVCPDFELPTAGMRSVLPDVCSREDAIFNLQRATLLTAAFATGSRYVFPNALSDRLHQPYRMSQVPGMEEILKLRTPGLLGCALSGAGPSILVLYETGHEESVESVKRTFEEAGQAAEVLWTRIDRNGLKIF